MTLALAATYEPNWWLLGLIFTVFFFGPIWIVARCAGRPARPTLRQRIVDAEQDEIVAAHRRRIAGTLD